AGAVLSNDPRQLFAGIAVAQPDRRFLDFTGPDSSFTATSASLSEVLQMAKAASIKVKLVSSADTGFYYVTRKNSRTMTDKLVKKKYEPVAKKHVEFRESKIK